MDARATINLHKYKEARASEAGEPWERVDQHEDVIGVGDSTYLEVLVRDRSGH